MAQYLFFLRRFLAMLVLLPGLLGQTNSLPSPYSTPSTVSAASYIVQARSTDDAARVVREASGSVIDRLSIIDGVVAALDGMAVARLRAAPAITIHTNRSVRSAGDTDCVDAGDSETGTAGCTLYPSAAAAVHVLHERYVSTRKTECKEQQIAISEDNEQRLLQGWGVTVAIVDSGFVELASPSDWQHKDSATGTLIAENSARCIIYRDFLERSATNGNAYTALSAYNSDDQHGHGTHVAATIGDNRKAMLAPGMNATPIGVAPQVSLMIARALNKDGAGTYGDVIAAVDWIVANKDTYNVRVLNLSLYSPVTGPYWADPLNQAVMRAWQAGLVVVVAAGNAGPEAGTITVPGNVPYVITVGALTSGRYAESGDDALARYSSHGPTESAFVKPDLLVPATRTIAPMPAGSTLAVQVQPGRLHETAKVDFAVSAPAKNHNYYQLSGTSMAAAQVSGIAALVLQKNPRLTNDQVKYRLMTTARPAVVEKTGALAYSIWEQGAGLVDGREAVFTATTESANQGMDISRDLTSDTHYWGYTTWDEATGEFRLTDPATGQQHTWGGGHGFWAGGTTTWGGGHGFWAGGTTAWSGGHRSWAGGLNTWTSEASFWAGAGRVWSGSTPSISLSTAAQAELLLNDDEPLPPPPPEGVKVFTPLVLRSTKGGRH
jgi:subtilisin family serine protease